MPRVSLIQIIEQEAEDCQKLALLNPSPTAEVFEALAISYFSLAKKLRDAAGLKGKDV